MRISNLNLTNWRNISEANLSTDKQFIFISGANASGKTTFLEALHLLFVGRSFRTREWQKVISENQNQAIVTANIGDDFLASSRIRSELPVQKLNSENTTVSAIAKSFPVQLFDNSLFDLFEGPPKQRRQLIDWGLFHVKHDFFEAWQRYKNILKQRNALLRQSNINPVDHKQLDIWDRNLSESGMELSGMRSKYSQELLSLCNESKLLDGLDMQFSYYAGWQKGESLYDALVRSREKDLLQKRTSVGPHQSDLKIKIESRKAGDVLSRGQKKLAAFAIKIEQIKMYNGQSNSNCFLLCDDFSAELDLQNQKLIIEELETLGSQAFITAIDTSPVLSMLTKPENAKKFHVKHGSFLDE